jgi:ABC-type glycerol-3-phosphate transport system permease component
MLKTRSFNNAVKISVIFFFILLLSGCDVEYNLTIDKDLNFTEEITAFYDHSYFDDLKYITKEEQLRSLVLSFNDELQNSPYEYSIINNKDGGGILLEAKYDGINTFRENSKIAAYKFKKYDLTQNGNIITLTTSSPYYYVEQDQERPPIKKLTVNITLPFIVTSNNADKVNGNTYSWIIGEHYDKTINLTFDKTKLTNHFNILGISISYITIGVIGTLLVIAMIAFILYRVNFNNNKI